MHGFGVLANRFLPHHMQRVKPLFEKRGFPVLMPQNAPYQRPEVRATIWKKSLLHWNRKNIALVAHSQGGIEALLLARDPEVRPLLHSVHLVASPLRGTPAAAGLVLVPAFVVRGLASLFEKESRRLYPQAAADLGGAGRSLVYPPEPEAVPEVPVFSYVCRTGVREFRRLPLPFMPMWLFTQALAGKNDGLVPVKSQCFGIERGPFGLNHGEQLGLMRDKSVRPQFEALWENVMDDVEGVGV